MQMKDKERQNDVIVIGSDHHNTLGVVESLGMAGLMPHVIIVSKTAVPNSFVLKSKYCKGQGFSTTYDDLIPLLHNLFGHRTSEKPVVITTNDQAASLLDHHLDELSAFLQLPGTGKQGELEYWMDKLNMIQLAKSVGMNIPETITVKRGETVKDFVFPCITKSVSTLKGAKTNLRICSNIDELNGFLSRQTQYDEVQVQQFIDKDFEYQFIGCSINGGREITIPGRTHIVRPNGFDNNFHKEFVENDNSFNDVLEQTKAFIRQTHYSGLFSVEFLRDKNGTDYFLEMNFRNDGGAICVTASGTNLPYLWYLSQTDYNAFQSQLEASTFTPVIYTPIFHYFYCMTSGEVSFKEWLRNNRRSNQFSTYFSNDTAPFWQHLKNERRYLLRALAHYLFRR